MKGGDSYGNLARILAEIRAANRARHVGSEPGINAVRVEHVVAFGEESEGIFVWEIGQAHSTFERFFTLFEVLDVGVEEGGKGIKEFPVDPLRAGAGDRGGGGLRGDDDPWLGTAAEVDGEDAHHKKSKDDGSNGDGNGGLPAVVGDVCGHRLHGRLCLSCGSMEQGEREECEEGVLKDVKFTWLRHLGVWFRVCEEKNEFGEGRKLGSVVWGIILGKKREKDGELFVAMGVLGMRICWHWRRWEKVNEVKKRSEVWSLCSLEKKGLCLCGFSGEEMQRNLASTTSFYFRISETNASKRILSVPLFKR